jgi:hypothetical protein
MIPNVFINKKKSLKPIMLLAGFEPASRKLERQVFASQ